MSKASAKAIKRAFVNEIKDYIAEAEHQDGIEYWLAFAEEKDPVLAILKDVMVYRRQGVIEDP